MTRILWYASIRYSLRHPWQFGLSLLGIALGVAVVVSIDLSIDSARRAFVLSNQAVLGAGTHRLRGGPAGIDEKLYVRLRTQLPGLPAAPVVEGWGSGDDGVAMRVLGIDVFAEAFFRPRLRDAAAASGDVLAALMTKPGAVLVSAATAARLGVGIGDRFRILINGRNRELELVAMLGTDDDLGSAALADVIVTDIATAQELLERIGRLSRVDLRLADGEMGAIEKMLPAGVRVERAGSGTRLAERMTGAFNLNLVMLGLLAVMVGMFLVYNTVTFSVLQRRQLIGALRAAGVTRGQIFTLVLVEAALVALAAVVAGLALGVGLAEQLVGLVSRTINDLYFAVNVRELTVTPVILAKGALLGLGAALAAAAVPAFEATRVAPRAAMARSQVEVRMHRRLPLVSAAGGLALLLALFLVWLPGESPRLGFAALFALVSGCALLAPGATVLLLRILRAPSTRLGGWLGGLALRGVAANLSRTAVAIAALMVALSATVGVGVMVDSFRLSVFNWLDLTMRADMYVGLPESRGERAIAPAIMARIAAVPGVADVSAGRGVSVILERRAVPGGDGRALHLVVLRMARGSYAGFQLLEGDASRVWPAFDGGGAVLVSESLARREGLAPGASVRLQSDRGVRAFPVAAVFRDYGSEQGTIVMARATYDRYWDDDTVSTLGVYADEDVDPAVLGDAVRDAIGGDQQLVVRATGAIKKASMEVFDRTFTITAVLRGLATIIAFVGILSALMALELERAKEIAVLRAQGLTPRQVWQLVQTQTGVMGLIAGVLSIPVGLAMALVLILVINPRSFGWSMDVHVDPAILLQSMALAVAAALIAGIYPAYRMAKISPASALRED
jgi:putative ABC transport system permease protein